MLTPKQKTFVKEYLIDLNATRASIRAGYSAKTATAASSRLLANVKIQAAIQKAMGERSLRLDISADNVLQEIAKLAFSDIRNVFDDQGQLLPVHLLAPGVSASISSIKVNTKVVPGSDPVEIDHITEVKFWDKGANLERLGKHLKLFNEVGSKDNPFCLEELTDEQLIARIAMRKKELGL